MGVFGHLLRRQLDPAAAAAAARRGPGCSPEHERAAQFARRWQRLDMAPALSAARSAEPLRDHAAAARWPQAPRAGPVRGRRARLTHAVPVVPAATPALAPCRALGSRSAECSGGCACGRFGVRLCRSAHLDCTTVSVDFACAHNGTLLGLQGLRTSCTSCCQPARISGQRCLSRVSALSYSDAADLPVLRIPVGAYPRCGPAMRCAGVPTERCSFPPRMSFGGLQPGGVAASLRPRAAARPMCVTHAQVRRRHVGVCSRHVLVRHRRPTILRRPGLRLRFRCCTGERLVATAVARSSACCAGSRKTRHQAPSASKAIAAAGGPVDHCAWFLVGRTYEDSFDPPTSWILTYIPDSVRAGHAYKKWSAASARRQGARGLGPAGCEVLGDVGSGANQGEAR